MTESTDTIQPGDMADVDPAAMELVVRIMQQSAKDAAWTTNQLLESYQSRTAELEATLNLIRTRISALLDGPYMPTSRAIEAALWPSSEQVQDWRGVRGEV